MRGRFCECLAAAGVRGRFCECLAAAGETAVRGRPCECLAAAGETAVRGRPCECLAAAGETAVRGRLCECLAAAGETAVRGRSYECLAAAGETVVWYPDPSVQAHARTRITTCACGKRRVWGNASSGREHMQSLVGLTAPPSQCLRCCFPILSFRWHGRAWRRQLCGRTSLPCATPRLCADTWVRGSYVPSLPRLRLVKNGVHREQSYWQYSKL